MKFHSLLIKPKKNANKEVIYPVSSYQHVIKENKFLMVPGMVCFSVPNFELELSEKTKWLLLLWSASVSA